MHSCKSMCGPLPGLLYLLFLSLFPNVAWAQNFLPTTSSSDFPGCAVGCNLLLQAQTLCVPPAVAVTSQFTYENCFCQSSLLQGLYSTPDAVCAAECTTESDRVLLQTWFRTFCNAVGQGVNPVSSTTLQPTATQSVVVITITSTSTSPGATSTGAGSANRSGGEPSQSWIQGHWRWILMVGLLLIGFGLLTWLLVWLKRRHRRKVDQRRATMSGFPSESEKQAGARSATPDLWGPHQHMNHTHGYEYDSQQVLGSGALGAPNAKRERRKSRRQKSHEHENEMAQMNERPPNSRRHSSKGKSRTLERIISNEPEIGPVERDRSRSQRRRDPDRDMETGSNPEHSRRLREVRGSRRNRNIDPP